MLRPAFLLPFLSIQGLSTLRFVRSDFSSRLESATGRSGAYPDGTFTREKTASFRTHHRFILR